MSARPPTQGADARWMRHAIALARRGDAAVRPNPRVGCVLVAGEQIVGEGFHARCGGPHAEAVALAQAGDSARGATAYVTLEPCSHHGRTPPCAQALIDAGVARVVIGMRDPHAEASGGEEALRQAGVAVTSGVLAAEAADVADVFLVNTVRRRAHVRLKLAATLDGYTAAADGSSQWITAPAARAEVHRLRAGVDAVAVGSGTALADDPRLDVRHGHCARQPDRVVFDRRRRTPPDAAVLQAARAGRGTTFLVTDRPDGAAPEGATEVLVPEGPGWLERALQALLARGVHTLLCEGGATLGGALLRDGLVDRLDVVLAPKLLGAGRGVLGELGITTLSDALPLRFDPPRQVGPDAWLHARPLTPAWEA